MIPPPVRGRPEPSAREIREAENDRAAGGVRLPRISARHVPRAAAFRGAARPVLLGHLSSALGISAASPRVTFRP
eukprot:9906411-Alexandrium_andersonii.AAC.2